MRSRTVLVTALCLTVALGVGLAGVVAGSSGLAPGQVLRVLGGGGDPAARFIVLELRLPRVAAALLVGLALGAAGALTQAFSRNPLATPDILGVTSGAAAGAVAAIVVGGGGGAVGGGLLGLGLPAVAALGALLAAGGVYGLSWRDGIDGYRLVLVGIGVGAVLTGVTGYLLVAAQLTQAAAATQWLVGSLSGVTWVSVWPVLAAVVVCLPLCLTRARALDVALLGDDVAVALGVRTQAHAALVLGSAVLLTAAAVSAAGPLAFVAFVSPQAARLLTGAARPPLLASGLAGAALVAGADLVGRTVLPTPVPVGILTAVVGAPALVWLLTRRSERTLS